MKLIEAASRTACFLASEKRTRVVNPLKLTWLARKNQTEAMKNVYFSLPALR